MYLLPAAVCRYSGTVGAPDRGRGPQSRECLLSEPSGETAHRSDCTKALPRSAGQGLHDGCCPSAGFWRLPVVDSGQGEHSEITSRGSRLPLPVHGRPRRPQSSLNAHPRFGKWNSDKCPHRNKTMYYLFCRVFPGNPQLGWKQPGTGSNVSVPGPASRTTAMAAPVWQIQDSYESWQLLPYWIKEDTYFFFFSFRMCLKSQKLELVMKHFKLTACLLHYDSFG